MAYIPHLLVSGDWDKEGLPLTHVQLHHLRTVLRLGDGNPLTYTNGSGRLGKGTMAGAMIARGYEYEQTPPRVRLTMAVAPPDSRERARFVVEKLAELGVAELVWIRTRHGQGRIPDPEKTLAWSEAALEQSRGAFLMTVGSSRLEDLASPLLVAHPGAESDWGRHLAPQMTVAIGPEAGFAADELPDAALTIGLGSNILRVETAAVVAAGLVLLGGGWV